MTQTEALKSAIEFAEFCLEELDLSYMASNQAKRLVEKAKEALAQPEQEPVGEIGWAANIPNTIREVNWTELCPPVGTKLYTTPPQRTWVGLTDEDIGQWIEEEHDVLRWAEAKLKEKNT